ncbi:hypothetical protein DICVIV_09493 [Dictyocaulus viviparus]|uniref:Uncharacterized protein n=1 Tax=Dictyocaulus viviparus TaxID=29172 RepID=A0A0D8XIK5_DICVI|nr:hypothetical protein DICVIV_09493 [Dictyocaulus viviparus]
MALYVLDFINSNELLDEIEEICKELLTLNDQLPHVLYECHRKTTLDAVNLLKVHYSSLLVNLIKLRVDVNQILIRQQQWQKRTPNELYDDRDDDVTDLNVTSPSRSINWDIMESMDNDVPLNDTVMETVRKGRRRSRSLSFVKKIIRRFSRSRTPRCRLTINIDNNNADVTLRESI